MTTKTYERRNKDKMLISMKAVIKLVQKHLKFY